MRVAFIGGAGRLGLPFALWTAECGHQVIISDPNQEELAKIRRGATARDEPGVDELVRDHKGCLILTSDDRLAAWLADLVCIIVGTPSTGAGQFSRQYMTGVAREIAGGLGNKYKVITVMSTVMPGDTRCIGQVLEEASGLTLGYDFGLAHSPEFIRQGSIIEDFSNPDFVVIGEYDQRSGDAVAGYYADMVQNAPRVHRMSLESAEVTKTGLNAMVIAKMALANELAWLCHAIPGADARDVLEAIGSDSRVGNRYFNAGTWPGGPCFPRDTRALAAAGLRAGMGMPIIEQVSHANKLELCRLVDLCEALMADYPRVGILGLTYKPGVAIMDESQGGALFNALAHLGDIDAHDPTVCQSDFSAFVQGNDLLVLMTCWPEYKALEGMSLTGKCVLDMWGFLDADKLNCARYVRFGLGE